MNQKITWLWRQPAFRDLIDLPGMILLPELPVRVFIHFSVGRPGHKRSVGRLVSNCCIGFIREN